MEISQTVPQVKYEILWEMPNKKKEILTFLLWRYKRLVALFARERGWLYEDPND